MNLIGPPKIYRRCCQDCRYFSQIPCTNNCIQWCYQSRGSFLGGQYSFHHSNWISNIPYQYPTGSICIDLSGMDKILEINGIISFKIRLSWLTYSFTSGGFGSYLSIRGKMGGYKPDSKNQGHSSFLSSKPARFLSNPCSRPKSA